MDNFQGWEYGWEDYSFVGVIAFAMTAFIFVAWYINRVSDPLPDFVPENLLVHKKLHRRMVLQNSRPVKREKSRSHYGVVSLPIWVHETIIGLRNIHGPINVDTNVGRMAARSQITKALLSARPNVRHTDIQALLPTLIDIWSEPDQYENFMGIECKNGHLRIIDQHFSVGQAPK